MSWLADAHSEWHAVNGRNEVCPLDCGVNEGRYDEYDMEMEEAPVTVDLEPATTPTEEMMWKDPWRDWSASEPPF